MKDPLSSQHYRDVSASDRWFLIAHAQCDCSVGLLVMLQRSDLPLTCFHAKVAVFLFEQSLESFLKAALSLRQARVPGSHVLVKLFESFEREFPAASFSDATNVHAYITEARPGPPNQFLRYPTDLNGYAWDDACGAYNVDNWLGRVRMFLGEFQRLEPLLRTQASAAVFEPPKES